MHRIALPISPRYSKGKHQQGQPTQRHLLYVVGSYVHLGQEIDEACLEVMQRTLDLDALACCESTLHGLGHWAHSYPQEVEAIISTWLVRNPFLKEALKEYAHAARKGHVL